MTPGVSDVLSEAEINAWCEQFAETPWVMLAMQTAMANAPSPLRVLRDAVTQMRALASRCAEAEDRCARQQRAIQAYIVEAFRAPNNRDQGAMDSAARDLVALVAHPEPEGEDRRG